MLVWIKWVNLVTSFSGIQCESITKKAIHKLWNENINLVLYVLICFPLIINEVSSAYKKNCALLDMFMFIFIYVYKLHLTDENCAADWRGDVGVCAGHQWRLSVGLRRVRVSRLEPSGRRRAPGAPGGALGTGPAARAARAQRLLTGSHTGLVSRLRRRVHSGQPQIIPCSYRCNVVIRKTIRLRSDWRGIRAEYTSDLDDLESYQLELLTLFFAIFIL